MSLSRHVPGWPQLLFLVLLGLANGANAQSLDYYFDEGLAAYNANNFDEARQIWQEGLDLAQKKSEPKWQSSFLLNLGLIHERQGQYAPAAEYYEKAVALDRQVQNESGLVSSLSYAGGAYSRLSQFDKAVSALEEVLPLARKLGDAAGERRILTNLGFSHHSLGHSAQALQAYEQAVKLREQLGEPPASQLYKLSNLVPLANELEHYDKGLTYGQKLLAARMEAGDAPGQAEARMELSHSSGGLNRTQDALAHAQAAVEIYRRLGDQTGEAKALGLVALSHYFLEKPVQAAEAYEQSIALTRKLGDTAREQSLLKSVAPIYQSLGNAAGQAARYDEAIGHLRKAVDAYRQIGEVNGEAMSLSGLGVYLSDVGRYPEALEAHEKARSLRVASGRPDAEAIDLTNIGTIHLDLAQYEKALANFERALQLSQQMKSEYGEMLNLSNLGLVYRSLGQPEKAIEHFEKALVLRRQQRDAAGEGNDLNNLGTALYTLGRQQEAIQRYEQALALARRAADPVLEANAHSNLGLALRDLGRQQEALGHLEQALPIQKKTGNRLGEATGLTNLGAVQVALGRYDEARRSFDAALQIRREIGDVQGEATVLSNIGGVLLGTGKPQEALAPLKAALELYEKIREQIRTGEARMGFQSTLPDVYRTLAAAQLAQGQNKEAFETIERGRARAFVELLATRQASGGRRLQKAAEVVALDAQIRQLRDSQVALAARPAGQKTRTAQVAGAAALSEKDRQRLALVDELRRADPELGSLLAVDPPKLSEIQSLLDPQVALVEFFHPGPYPLDGRAVDELWIFVLKRNAFHFTTAPVKQKELQAALEKYAAALEDPDSSMQALQASMSQLRGWLVAPVSQLADAQTWLVVPWAGMFHMPFSTLAEERQVVVAPSAGIYRYLLKKRTAGHESILAVGNPKTPLAPLPGAEREAEEVSALFRERTLLKGSQATESRIKGSPGKAQVAHLACHGVFNSEAPELTYLALTADGQEDGRLELHEIFGLDWSGVSLVTLSACESGKARLGAGNDVVGLTRGFFFAGAPSVLASLWEVDDEATRTFMLAFYKAFTGGKSKPEALAAAQQAVRSKAQWAHPNYWAAFVLFGDWQ